MIQNLIFDLGGVIVDFNPRRLVISCFGEDADFDLLESRIFAEHWSDMDKGIHTPLEAAQKICAVLPERYHPGVQRLFRDHWPLMPFLHETCAFIAEMKAQGYGIYLLSNTNSGFHENMAHLPVFQIFDGLFVSGDHKMLKPSKEIYETFLHTFHLKPETCLFIDDKQENLDGAAAVGIRGYHFATKNLEGLRQLLVADKA